MNLVAENKALFGAGACLAAALLVLAIDYTLHDQIGASLAYLRAAKGGLQPPYQTVMQPETTVSETMPVPNVSQPAWTPDPAWQQQNCDRLRMQLAAMQRQYDFMSQRADNLLLRSSDDARRGDHDAFNRVQNFISRIEQNMNSVDQTMGHLRLQINQVGCF